MCVCVCGGGGGSKNTSRAKILKKRGKESIVIVKRMKSFFSLFLVYISRENNLWIIELFYFSIFLSSQLS